MQDEGGPAALTISNAFGNVEATGDPEKAVWAGWQGQNRTATGSREDKKRGFGDYKLGRHLRAVLPVTGAENGPLAGGPREGCF